MTVNHRDAAETGAGGATAPGTRGRVLQLPAVLLTWSRKRLATAVVTTAASAVFLLVATAMPSDPATDWTRYASIAAAAVFAGLLAGSYVGAPIGAAATFCDLRWPVAGLFGVIWANSPREAQPPVQIAVGVLAMAVMAWALRARLQLERRVTLAPGPENAGPEVCTDCRPLFPAKPQPHR